MNDEDCYTAILTEIPALEEMRKLVDVAPGVWQTMILAVYRQGKVDQLEHWILANLKGE